MNDDTKGIALVIAIVALFALAIYAAVKDREAKQKCIDHGGTIHEFNCSASTSCGSNGFCTTTQHCEWQCVGGAK